MTSAKPSCPRNRPSRVRYPPSTAVRSSPSPSSANGPRFPASGPSTALPANSSGPPARPQPVQHHRPPDPQRQTAGSELAHRLGWYFGFHPLAAVTPTGVITGFGFGPASADDLPLAETLFALRAQPDPRLPSAGRPASGEYVADSGFSGRRTVSPVTRSPKRNEATVAVVISVSVFAGEERDSVRSPLRKNG